MSIWSRSLKANENKNVHVFLLFLKNYHICLFIFVIEFIKANWKKKNDYIFFEGHISLIWKSNSLWENMKVLNISEVVICVHTYSDVETVYKGV